MKLTLNVYGKVDGKRQVVKTYTQDTIFVSTGSVSQLLEVLDLSQLQAKSLDNDSLIQIANTLLLSYKSVLPIVQEVFEVTDEDFKNTNQAEVLRNAAIIVKSAFSDLMSVITAQNEKN